MSTNPVSESKAEALARLTAEGGFATRAIHAGQPADSVTGAVTVPISLATTFVQHSPGQMLSGFEYSRTGNPTRLAFERCVAACEKGKYALAFSSGSAACGTMLQTLNHGDHIISVADVYGGTQRYFRRVAERASGLETTFVDFNDEAALRAAFRPNTKLLWLETPTNPTLTLTDIRRVADIAHEHQAVLLVDNTFMSPALQNPLALGADVVLHSVTKYMNGHSDVVMGVLITDNDRIFELLKFLQNGLGAVPAPFDCYMAMRGLKTLDLRMREHSSNAMTVAKFLEAHPKVTRVVYPGLPSHPQHELAKRQMRGFGGMITFYTVGGLDEARTFLESLRLVKLAESLGAVESLAEHPAIMTHASVPPEQRKLLGISDSLVRLSVGIEDVADILFDLSRALDAIKA